VLPGRTALHPRRILSSSRLFGLLGRLLAMAVIDGRLLEHAFSDKVCRFLFASDTPPDAARSQALMAMRKGFQHGIKKLFHQVPQLLLVLFPPEERPMLLRGSPLSAAEVALALQVVIPPFVTHSTQAAKVKTWLKVYVASLNQKALARFFRFVTNAPCAHSWVAVGAGDALQPISFQFLSSLPSSRLPFAMVSQRLVQCPLYGTKNALLTKLGQATEGIFDVAYGA